MSGKPKRKDSIEISSAELRAELIEIKDRVGALETIASISNKEVVERFVRESIRGEKARQILKECGEPRTREYLIEKFGFASPQALDHHLNPLRQADLIRHHFDDDGKQMFEWSNLFRRLPKATLRKILHECK
jgi:DNA-binding transcriptional ArsR family regulator